LAVDLAVDVPFHEVSGRSPAFVNTLAVVVSTNDERRTTDAVPGLGQDVAAVYDSHRTRSHHRMLTRRRSEVVSDIQQDRRRHHRDVRRAQGFGLATAGVSLA
jgi:hypothetical protein